MTLMAKALNQILTFSRAGGATRINAAGLLVGVDFSSTSNTIGTGSKTFTLGATASVDRSWVVGDTVLAVDQSGGGTMTGTVASYTPSSQALVLTITSMTGSGTSTNWRIGNTMPRIDYDPVSLVAKGLLVENQVTNQVANANDFSSSTFNFSSNVTATPASGVSPDGSTNAWKVVNNTGNSIHEFAEKINTSTCIRTLHVKQVNYRYVVFGDLNSGSYAPVVRFDLQLGTYSVLHTGGGGPFVDASITPAANGFYRLRVNGTSIDISNWLQTNNASLITGQSETGDGTSYNLYYGYQIGDGSYIPTNGTQVTRSADSAAVSSANFTQFFNTSTGTLLFNGTNLGGDGPLLQIDDGTENNRLTIKQLTGNIIAEVIAGGSSQASLTLGAAPAVGTNFKAALSYAAGAFNGCLNGGTVQTASSGTVPTGLSQLRLAANTTVQSNARMGLDVYYTSAKTGSAIQGITT